MSLKELLYRVTRSCLLETYIETAICLLIEILTAASCLPHPPPPILMPLRISYRISCGFLFIPPAYLITIRDRSRIMESMSIFIVGRRKLSVRRRALARCCFRGPGACNLHVGLKLWSSGGRAVAASALYAAVSVLGRIEAERLRRS